MDLKRSERMKAVEQSILTEREFEAYLYTLNILEGDLERWKTIVDLGAGAEQEFAKGLKVLYPDKNVISIDPRLALSEKRDLETIVPEDRQARLRGRKMPESGSLGSLAQELPIRDDSIDAVLALHSVPQYLERPEDISLMLLEIVRVLKINGEARFYPVLQSKDMNIINEILGPYTEYIQMNFILKEEVGGEKKYLLILEKKKEIPKA